VAPETPGVEQLLAAEVGVIPRHVSVVGGLRAVRAGVASQTAVLAMCEHFGIAGIAVVVDPKGRDRRRMPGISGQQVGVEGVGGGEKRGELILVVSAANAVADVSAEGYPVSAAHPLHRFRVGARLPSQGGVVRHDTGPLVPPDPAMGNQWSVQCQGSLMAGLRRNAAVVQPERHIVVLPLAVVEPVHAAVRPPLLGPKVHDDLAGLHFGGLRIVAAEVPQADQGTVLLAAQSCPARGVVSLGEISVTGAHAIAAQRRPAQVLQLGPWNHVAVALVDFVPMIGPVGVLIQPCRGGYFHGPTGLAAEQATGGALDLGRLPDDRKVLEVQRPL